MKKILVLALALSTIGGCAHLKQAGTEIGQASKQAATEIGHTSRDVTRSIGHSSRDAEKSIKKDISEK